MVNAGSSVINCVGSGCRCRVNNGVCAVNVGCRCVRISDMSGYCMVHCTGFCLCLDEHCWALSVQCWTWCSKLRRLIFNIEPCIVNVGGLSTSDLGRGCLFLVLVW